MYVLGLFVAASVQKPLRDLQLSIANHPEVYSLPLFTLASVLRILAAYIIALVWTLGAGILISRSKTLSQLFMPLFDIGQSVPALALFPFIILVVFTFIGTGETGLEIASVLLLLTGTQWYLLFNIIGAIKHIPGDVIEAANSFGIKDWDFVRYVLLPAIFPGIIVGSIQAWGGAWNATIVSEYINYGGHVQLEMNYSGVALSNLTVTANEKISQIPCSAGTCSGLVEVDGVGPQNASIDLRSQSGEMKIPLSFNVGDIGNTANLSAPLEVPFQSGHVTLVEPLSNSSLPLQPYSVMGLGAFLDRASSEWGDPWMVVLALASMSLTVIFLNHFVWNYLFKKAERYKFEMT
jgi:ABC-type anion transport system duplicated permease subunit